MNDLCFGIYWYDSTYLQLYGLTCSQYHNLSPKINSLLFIVTICCIKLVFWCWEVCPTKIFLSTCLTSRLRCLAIQPLTNPSSIPVSFRYAANNSFCIVIYQIPWCDYTIFSFTDFNGFIAYPIWPIESDCAIAIAVEIIRFTRYRMGIDLAKSRTWQSMLMFSCSSDCSHSAPFCFLSRLLVKSCFPIECPAGGLQDCVLWLDVELAGCYSVGLISSLSESFPQVANWAVHKQDSLVFLSV